MKRTSDIKFFELCDEIDYWKEQAEHYKEKYETELSERMIDSNQRLKEAQSGVANALLFALSVTDGEDGELIINKENRKSLSKSWIKNEQEETE